MSSQNGNQVKQSYRGGENDFTGKAADWEKRVFLNAEMYTVIIFHGSGLASRFSVDRERQEHESFIKARREAEKHKRALIYAVTATGRSDCLTPARWDEYERLWRYARNAGGDGREPLITRERMKPRR